MHLCSLFHLCLHYITVNKTYLSYLRGLAFKMAETKITLVGHKNAIEPDFKPKIAPNNLKKVKKKAPIWDESKIKR